MALPPVARSVKIDTQRSLLLPRGIELLKVKTPLQNGEHNLRYVFRIKSTLLLEKLTYLFKNRQSKSFSNISQAIDFYKELCGFICSDINILKILNGYVKTKTKFGKEPTKSNAIFQAFKIKPRPHIHITQQKIKGVINYYLYVYLPKSSKTQTQATRKRIYVATENTICQQVILTKLKEAEELICQSLRPCDF